MADNVAVSAGSGTSIATDDVGGVHFQRVKLHTGEDGSAEPIGDDDKGSSRALWVRPRPLAKIIQVTPGVSSTPAYTSGDCLGGLQSIANAATEAGGTGVLQTVMMLDRTAAQRPAIDLMFFNDAVTSAGDNAPVAFSDADMTKCIGIVALGPYNTAFPGTALNSLATTLNINLPYNCIATTLYCQAVVRATPTLTSAGDITFTFGVILD